MAKTPGYIPIIFLWLVFTVRSVAQEYIVQIQHYGLQEGLSHRNVHFSLQDHRGLMWFGTDYGLNRFDGYNFKWITKEKHGLYSNTVGHAMEDRDGRFWIFYGAVQLFIDYNATVEHIDIFDPLSEKVLPFEAVFTEKNSLQPADIIHFTQKENGDLVFLTKGHEIVTYSGNGQFSSVSLQEQYAETYGFYRSTTGQYWIRVVREDAKEWESWVVAIDEKGEEAYSFPLRNRIGEKIFFYQTKGNPDQKWISVNLAFPEDGFVFHAVTPGGRQVNNTDAALYAKFDLDFTPFAEIARMEDEGAFSCFFSEDGFFIVDKKHEDLYPLHGEYPDLAYARHLEVGNEGKIWVSTEFGIYLITLKKNFFTKMLASAEGLNPVRGLALDKGNRLWVVKENDHNIWYVQLAADKRGVLFSGAANEGRIPGRLPVKNLHYPLILARSGQIYYCSGGYEVSRFNPENFQYRPLKSLERPEKMGSAWNFAEDDEGRIWAGYANGLIGLFGEAYSEWLPLVDDENFSCTTYQFIDRGPSWWMVTSAGLFLFDKTNRQTVERYWSEGEGRFRLPFDDLRHAYLEKDSTTFWLGTAGSGLVRFDTRTGQYRQFTKADGLSNNVIYAVYPDGAGNLWLPSDYGIMRFDKTTHQVNTYLEQDGITNNEFNRISHLQATDGTLFFGGLNGITAFHPDDFEVDSSAHSTPMAISSFQQFLHSENRLVDKTAELIATGEIVMAPNDPFFRLEFGLLTYEDVDKLQYAYKIEDQDQDWVYQKENFIRLSRLPYGEHLLRVRGQGANGQWSDNELAIRLVVRKPVYFQPWFLVLCAAILLISGPAFYKIRTARLERQKAQLEAEVARQTEEIREQAEQLKSLEQLKSRFFANVSHELRTPLTLMLGPLSNLLKRDYWQAKDQKLLLFVQNNGKQLLKLVNEILDLSKLETGRLEVKEEAVHLHEFLQPLLAQFRSFGDSESVKLKLEYLVDPDLHILLDTGKFEKIVHNYLSNALKFTPPGGAVTLTVEDPGDQLLVKVTDTGPGIHPDDLPHVFDRFYQSKQPDAPTQGGTGIGLSLCKELAELLVGRVWAESELGKGSTFYFKFPKKVVNRPPSPIDRPPSSVSRPPSPLDRPPSPVPRPPSTVLVTEDNPELREYLTVLLSDQYNVITAENGKVAWDLLTANGQQLTADLIISDLMMPVMDGFQLMEKVKSSDALRHIPYIMLTARADVRVKLRALRIGVDDYITKPFVEEELTARIENLLRNYEERKAFLVREEEDTVADLPEIAAADMEWLEKLEQFYLQYLDDSRLSVNFAAQHMLLSERQFHRQLKKLTGLTPNQYLREIRLDQARWFIETGKYQTVKETCYAVGFSDVPYFTKMFRERFGANPSDLFS